MSGPIEDGSHHLRPPADTFPSAAHLHEELARTISKVRRVALERDESRASLARAMDRNAEYVSRLGAAHDYALQLREALAGLVRLWSAFASQEMYGEFLREGLEREDAEALDGAYEQARAALALPLPPGLLDEEALAEVAHSPPKRVEQLDPYDTPRGRDPFEGVSVHEEDEA